MTARLVIGGLLLGLLGGCELLVSSDTPPLGAAGAADGVAGTSGVSGTAGTGGTAAAGSASATGIAGAGGSLTVPLVYYVNTGTWHGYAWGP